MMSNCATVVSIPEDHPIDPQHILACTRSILREAPQNRAHMAYKIYLGDNTKLRGKTRIRVVLKRKKFVPKRQFCKKAVCSSYVQPWLVAIDSWWLVGVGGW